MNGFTTGVRRVFDRLGPACRIAFHHVPKTGGTSVAAALRRRYPLSSSGFDQTAAHTMVELLYPEFDRAPLFSDEFLRFRREYFVNLLAMGERCISGHFPFDEIAYERFRDEYHFVTVLRDPVKRFISHYFDSYQPEAGRDRPFAIAESLSELLETERGRRFGRIYSEFYSGLHERTDYSSDAAIARAKRNLGKFSVVGFLEDTEDFVDRLSRSCGLRVKLRHLRRGKVPETQKHEALTPAVVERIRSICAVDIQIYDWARDRFGRPVPDRFGRRG